MCALLSLGEELEVRKPSAFREGFPEGPTSKLDWDGEVLPYFAFSSELKVIVDPDTACVC